ncbi:hypothetical protein PG985_001766 [Apiospora marii]|uniref:uncharacterized protein n=1 Tax=Apiospora marii TaxID=335849 RepID=UPI00312E4708
MPVQKRSRSPSVDLDQSSKRQEVAIASPSRADHSPNSQPDNSQPGNPSQSTLRYKGKEYTLFQPWERMNLDALLFTQKHSVSRLRDARYFMLHNSDPSVLGTRYKMEDFTTMPAYDPSHEKLRHVSIACSHVECEGNTPEVSHITVLNLSNGEEIINSYVWPKAPVIKWDYDRNDRAVTEDVLTNASMEGGVIVGWEAVRKKLAQYVDAQTIFVGYGLSSGLKALRISHTNVFDYLIARRDCAKDKEVLQKAPYDHYYPKIQLPEKPELGADGRYDYYERALRRREIAINYLKRPWGAYQLSV